MSTAKFTLHVFASHLQLVGFWDLSGSEGRIGDGSDIPPASHFAETLCPSLLFFLTLTFPAATSRTLARVL
jgi:hypothetical protein